MADRNPERGDIIVERMSIEEANPEGVILFRQSFWLAFDFRSRSFQLYQPRLNRFKITYEENFLFKWRDREHVLLAQTIASASEKEHIDYIMGNNNTPSGLGETNNPDFYKNFTPSGLAHHNEKGTH